MVFLFDQTGAASAECFQIRTKTFHLPRWGLTELLKRENKVAPGTGKTKGKKTAKPKLVPGLSIIGKMYHEHLGQLSVGAVAPLKVDIDWFWRPATLEDGEVAILLPMRWSALEQVGVTILDIGDPTFKPVGVTYGGFTDSPGVSERLSNGFRLSVLTPSLSAEILAQVVAEPLTDDEMVH